MPLASSDTQTRAPRRGRLNRLRPALSLGMTLALAPLLGPAPQALAQARNTWLRGVFPVASFAGYTSPFGMRSHPLSGDLRPHYGVDIAGPLGSPVRSWWSGRLSEVIGDGGCGIGNGGGHHHSPRCAIACHVAQEDHRTTVRSLEHREQITTDLQSGST